MNELEMYLDFRKELDKYWVPVALSEMMRFGVFYRGKVVGLLGVRKLEGDSFYIDCVYIKRRYRRKGNAKRAVLNLYKGNRYADITLHIIHNNEPAQKFWRNIFELEEVARNETESLYRIVGLKCDED